MNSYKNPKSERILTIYQSLLDGTTVRKNSLAQDFNVNPKSIQRDIEDIRTFISQNVNLSHRYDIIYDHKSKGYILDDADNTFLKEDKLLAVCKILLESRAFCKDEMDSIIRSLLSPISKDNQKIIKELIGNEQFHHTSLRHNNKLLEKIWELSKLIREQGVIKIIYTKMNDIEVVRTLRPVSIIFSEYYFYLIAFFDNDDYDFPIVYRLDRINSFETTGAKFSIPESKRFKAGEFRNRIQFMYSGELKKLKFYYTGSSLEAVLDRLPTSKVSPYKGKGYLISAEVFGNGVVMWLLGQGRSVQVIEPSDIVTTIKDHVRDLYNMYNIK